MKNAFSRIGQTCVSTLTKGAIAGVLLAGGVFAASIHPVTVTLPHAVTVGATTLPSGEYTLSSVDMNDSSTFFVLRSVNGAAVTLQARKIDPPASDKTSVTFQKDGDAWHLGTLFIRGDASGYQFTDRK